MKRILFAALTALSMNAAALTGGTATGPIPIPASVEAQFAPVVQFAVQVAFQQAVFEGDAWKQSIYAEILRNPISLLSVNISVDGQASVVAKSAESLCVVEMVIEAATGFVASPVSFSCPVLEPAVQEPGLQ